MRLRRTRLVCTAVLFGLVSASTVQAEALVQVKLRDAKNQPAEGEVTIKPLSGEGASHSCKTSAGACDIAGVPGGRYEVSVKPASGAAPPTRKIMIPPSGKVSLIVSTAAKGS